MRKLLAIMTVVVLTGCSAKTEEQNSSKAIPESSAHMAHENYVDAINSNNLDSLLGILTDDVVFLAAGEPVMEGKAVVKPWVEGYYQAYKTHWDKTVDEFKVCGEWAFERYSWHSTDTSLEDSSVYEDTGWGLVIYHYDNDGKWRVARDAWGPDHAMTE